MLTALAVLAIFALFFVGPACYLTGRHDGREQGIAQERARSRKAMEDVYSRIWTAYWRMYIELETGKVIERMMGKN